MDHIVLTQYTIYTEKPVEELRVLMISDLHLGTTMNAEELEVQCERIQERDPDLILLVGDIFDENTTEADMQEACRMLGALESRYGTYYVYGNHEIYSFWAGAHMTLSDTLTQLSDQGIHVLTDESVEVAGMTIIGRRDRNSEREPLETLLADVNPDTFVLLMDHQPVDMTLAAELGVDLQVSGHTHAGQIWPMGLIAPYVSSNDMNYGLRQEGSYSGIVSSGIGGWGFPIRTEGHSEIVEIAIHSKEIL